MPLTVSNACPRSDTSCGTNDHGEYCQLGFWYSCAVIKTGNVLVREYIINQNPYLVEINEQFNNHDVFEHIKIACNVDTNDLTKTEST